MMTVVQMGNIVYNTLVYPIHHTVYLKALCNPLLLTPGSRLGMASVPLQQQFEWDISRRNGLGENHPNHRTGHPFNGEETRQWTLPDYCSSIVSPIEKRIKK